MDYRSYAQFLPAEYTADLVAPTSTWWQWRDTRVHIARTARTAAPVRGMIVHGGGGYSHALWPAAAIAASEGFEVFAPDLPLFGDTVPADPAGVRYDDWVDLLCDLVRAERAADPRPLILFGASMGGMLAYEVATRTSCSGEGGNGDESPVAAVVATCLLDMTDPAARAAATRHPWLGRTAPRLLPFVTPVLGRVRVPLRWLEDMDDMSNDPRLSQLCARDPRGGGGSAPLGFLESFMTFAHTPPQDYTGAPVTLVAPAADKWTPAALSIRFLQRISAPTDLVMLDNCGHFPIEEPGVGQLKATMIQVAASVAPGR